jgi:hypothetical protein
MCLVGAAARLLSHTMDSVIGGMPAFFGFLIICSKPPPLTPSLSKTPHHPYLYLSRCFLCSRIQSVSNVYGGGTCETTEKSGGF